MVQGSGATLRTRSFGAPGAPSTLILIHGGPGLSHPYMRPLERLATVERRVVSYDQRGVGGSSPTFVHTLDAHVADLEAVRASTNTERVHLLGHSFGGLVAMAYATKHPSHVASLILVDSIPPSRDAWDRAGDRFDKRKDALQQQGLVPSPLPMPKGPDCSPRLIALLPVYYANPKHPATKDLAGSTCTTGVAELTWLAFGPFDLRPALASVAVPSLVIAGAEDPFGAEMPDDVATALPASKPEKTLIPACGHIPWEECGAEFDARVRRFLELRGS